MFDELIAEIQAAVKPELVTVDGEVFLSRPVHLPPEARVTPLKMATLTGLVDFIEIQPEELLELGALVQVIAPTSVAIVGEITGREKERDVWAIADCSSIIGNGFRFGQYHPTEDFIINVMTNFVDNENRALLLQLVSNLQDETIKTSRDDGYSQVATVRSGVSMVAEVKIKNPIRLAPYRTFQELDQPEGEFVLRLQKGRNDKPEIGLWASDGGAWKLDAIARIKAYLATHIQAEIPILA